MNPRKPTTNDSAESALIQVQLETPMVRRGLLLKFASTVFASLVAPGVLARTLHQTKTKTQVPAWFPTLPEKDAGEDVLIRMMRDLQVAFAKPEVDRRWIMVIDLRKCTGCHA